jgi:hypothetical protein
VRNRNLPSALERQILSFVDFSWLGLLAHLSKAMMALLQSFFETSEKLTADEPFYTFASTAWAHLRHCSRLRALYVPLVTTKSSPAGIVACLQSRLVATVTRCSSTFECLELKDERGRMDGDNVLGSTRLAVALSNAPNLTSFTDFYHPDVNTGSMQAPSCLS